MAILEDVGDVLRCMIAAKEKYKEAGERYGMMQCPKCKGMIHWMVNGSRGHTAGRCETDDCIQWIE